MATAKKHSLSLEGSKVLEDPLHPKFQAILNNAGEGRRIKYNGEPLTTLASYFYGNTSLWYLILTVNGYEHPDEMSKGAIIRIPDITGVDQAISSKHTKRGTIVQI